MRYRYRKRITALLASALLSACAEPPGETPPGIAERLHAFDAMPGFVDLYWDDARGRLILGVDALDAPLLYQSSLARGVGSNDLGLDRGQLGSTRVVQFRRVGPRVLLVEENLGYRATSDDPEERRAVIESFAASVIWGFEVAGEAGGRVLLDATDFLLRDSYGIAAWLEEAGEGSYSVDATRSAIHLPRTRAFPDNAEIEAVVTFAGKPEGEILETVVPDATSFTVHLHHSFIRLPDHGYEPLPYDPRAGIIGLSYGRDGFLDYATQIGEPLTVTYGRRHRLEKQDPSAEVSEAVEPVVYYVDRGAPEPVRTALIEGASWWNAAFEAAGYRNAFRVELLPEGADPMDVRYNVIQWVHRSTRGWSYGSSVLDPRTGEILKGHVTLGSLRVRQDYLIAEGLLAPYDGEIQDDAALDMALARIRQLSAHEVGHTLGFEHNFAASTQGRTSVMDYPFPLLGLTDDGGVDLGEAYGVGLGDWDYRTVLYAYQDFPDAADADAERAGILEETLARGLRFVSDEDSRAVGTAHPDGNLWDNGSDAVAELGRLMDVRRRALDRMSADSLRPGRPLATLEEVLVPVFLLHRYQLQAAGKLIGGYYFDYALKGDGRASQRPVSADRQRAALAAILATIRPQELRLPDALVDAIPPRPPGHSLTRETFARATGKTFDPVGPARSAVSLTLDVLLDPARGARMVFAHALQDELPGFDELLSGLLDATWYAPRPAGIEAEIQRATAAEVLKRLMLLANDAGADSQVRALALDAVDGLDSWLAGNEARESDADWRALYGFARLQIERMRRDPSGLDELAPAAAPPGSPIGETRP